jgi:heterodisulfide reductase subunit B
VKYAFFPGCSLESTAWDFAASTREVCKALGIDLEDIPGWVCCGSTPAHSTNSSLAIGLPVFNLQQAQQMQRPVMTACASCYARLRTANHVVRNDAKERERAQRITDSSYDGSVDVFHVLDVLVNQLGVDAIRKAVKQNLKGLRVASYYGCLLTRPPKVVAFDDPEHPTTMDNLVAALGADPVDWPYKTECCGASLSMTHSKTVSRLSHRLVDMANRAGAECIVVACPLCQVNLDMRQSDARKNHGALPETPVLYVTQLLGLALGIPAERLGIQALSVNPNALLKKLLSPGAGESAGNGEHRPDASLSGQCSCRGSSCAAIGEGGNG